MTPGNDSLKQARSQVQVASARSQVQLTCEKFPRGPLRGSAWSRCKNPWFFAISNMLARPSAEIRVVEVKKLRTFYDFCGARATLCGDRRGRGAKTHGFLRFLKFPRDPLRGSAWSRCKNPWFLRFLKFPRDPLRGSAWSRCKNSRFFATFVVRTGPRELSRGSRVLPEPAGRGFDSSLVRGRASQDATCILKQLAQSNLRRASCTEQLAQTNLHRPVCAEHLA